MPRGETNTQTSKQKQRDDAILSKDPQRAMQEMMSAIDDLRCVYIEETNALENVDTQAFLNLQDRKLESARRYQRGIEEILARKDEMRKVDPSLKRRLEQMQGDFSTLAQDNMQALSRMQRTMERLGNTIRSAAKEAVNKQRAFSYSPTGALESNEKKILSTGVSETA